MEINYPLVGMVVLALIALLYFLIRRNQKDEKDFEREIGASEVKPEKHREDGKV